MADKVCPKLPIIWGRETFTTLTSITARKVPDITANVINHFFPADAVLCRWLGTGADATEGLAIHPSFRSLHLYHWNHGHPWAEQMVWVRRSVKDNLHRYALHDLNEVASGVLRRQQTKTCSGASLDAVDVPSEDLTRI